MKRYLLPLVLLVMPFALAAQQDPMALYPDFYNGIKNISAIVWDDHANIATVNLDNETFELTAINDQMQQVWRSSFAGYPLQTARFKDKIIAIAATEHSNFKGAGNTYVAYLVDATNGKQLATKEIYHGPDDYMEIPAVFTGEGSFVKLCVRQTAFTRKVHMAFPGMFAMFSMGKYEKEFNETRELDVVTLNDKLDATTIKLPVANGSMVNWCANKRGDLFIAWFNGPTIEMYKYPDGSSSPVKQINADISFVPSDKAMLSESFLMHASAANPDVVYYATTYSNQDNDAELGVGKMNFSDGKKAFVTEAFNRDHVKTLEKSFVTINKKADDVNLGMRSALHIRNLGEAGGTLIATVTSQHFQSSSIGSGVWSVENSVLVNGFDENLGTRFQQILPANYGYPNRFLPIGYFATKDKFYCIGNEKSGLATENGIFGCLDLASGKWEKMQVLSKKHLDNGAYVNGNAVMWFANSFAVPYIALKGLSQGNMDITLQQNGY
jgi:hypothetical protein